MSDDLALPQPRQADFSDLHVAVGCRVQLRISSFGREKQFATALIGYLPDEFLIVRTPIEGGLPLRLQNGDVLKARLFTGTDVVEFDTAVARQFGAPAPYWHLGYPDQVRLISLRAAPRMPVDLPVQVRTGAAAAQQPGRFTDLSALGAQVVTAQSLGDPGADIVIAFSLPRNGGSPPVELSVAAKIKSVKPLPDAGDGVTGCAHGVQFDNLDERAAMLLQNFVLARFRV